MPTSIYRLTHYQNVPFILKHGLHCANSKVHDEHFVNIGFKSLIEHRSKREVPVEPGGVLHDYVPFFFCKKPVMLYPISKKHVEDYEGNQEEIIYLISSAELVNDAGLKFVFSDRHALLDYAHYSNRLEEIKQLDWKKIETEQWGLMFDETKQTQEIKQAEFLIHNHLPKELIKAIVCANETTLNFVQPMIDVSGLDIKLHQKRDYYY